MASATHVTIRKRLALFFLFVAVILFGLGCRLGYLQFYKSRWLSENAVDQRVRNIPVEPKRGIIYDRSGRELAVSISSESVYAIPAEIQNVDDTAAKLAAILNLDSSRLAAKLKRRQAFTWIDRKIGEEKAQAVRKLDLAGIGLTEEGRRYYPHGRLASHILGFTGIDSQGLDGVELTFDSWLRGRPGAIVVEYDARGREIPYAVHRFVPPVDGNHLYLTIDLVIQQIVERELEKVLAETQAQAATIVALQPQTGEILALANKPDYDPNHFADYPAKLWRNPAVSNAYEPGSTFKILTTAAVLGEGVVRLEDRFFDPGGIEVQGRTIHCWKRGGHGSESFLQVVENSCNVGFVTVGLRLGKDPFYRYLRLFGLGKATKVDLPGEAAGIMINENKATPINIATMAMGQSIAVTPLQLADAVAAAVNGGRRLRPQIVRAIYGRDGEAIRTFQPDVLNQVISPEVSKTVRSVLESVVANGTGKNAAVPGYRIGGKTGTAQKVGGGGYMPGKYVASFAGFAPADDPQIVLLVVIDEPVGMYYGGQIAAPVFAAAMRDILQYLKIAPAAVAAPKAPAAEHVVVPNVVNMSPDEAKKALAALKLAARIEPGGERVADQTPKPGGRVPEGTKILLYTVAPPRDEGEVTVPDCTGKTLPESTALLTELGLVVRPYGRNGPVLRQDPPGGGRAVPGSQVEIYLEDWD